MFSKKESFGAKLRWNCCQTVLTMLKLQWRLTCFSVLDQEKTKAPDAKESGTLSMPARLKRKQKNIYKAIYCCKLFRLIFTRKRKCWAQTRAKRCPRNCLQKKSIDSIFHQESEVARGYWFLFPSYNKRNESAGRKRERNAACDPSLVFRRETKALDANESGTVSCMGKEIVTFNHLAIGPFLWNCDGLAFNIRPCLIASWTCKTQSPATTSWQTGKARYRFRSSRTQLKHLCFELPLNLTVARPLAWGLNHWLQRLQPNASHHTWEEKKVKIWIC